MHSPQKSRLERLHRIQWFMNHNAKALGAVNKSRTRAALDAIVPVLEGHAKDQHSAEVEAQAKTEIKAALREDLRVHHMQQVSTIARSKLAGVADTPLMTKFQYPRASADDVSLVAAGQSMAEAAQQYKQVFLDEQLPDDFIEQLQAATEAVRTATSERDGSHLQLREATEGVTVELQRASHVVRVLNTLVVRQLKNDPELLSAWNMAKRIRAKGSARSVQGVPVPPVQSALPAEVKAAA